LAWYIINMNNAATKPAQARKRLAKGMPMQYRCCQTHGWQPATYLFGTVDFHKVQLADGTARLVFKFPGWRNKLQAV